MTTDNPVDLRRLRYFVAVARAAGFRQAAAALGIAQPPLSQQVMALEKQLGQRLFIRHARTVELTDAGRALLVEAEPLLAHAAEIPERLRRAVIGETGTLRIGFTPALAHHSLLPYLLREFRAEAAGIALSFREEDTDLLCEALEAGRVDVAFIRPPAPLHARLRIETLVDEPLMLAVPKSHRLAQHSAVPLKEISDEDFVMFERALAPSLYDMILATCTEVGFSMRVVHHAPQKVSAMMLVAGGAGIAIVPSTLAGIHSEALRVLPIEGRTPTASIGLALRNDDQGVLPKRFSKFCLDQCKSAASATLT